MYEVCREIWYNNISDRLFWYLVEFCLNIFVWNTKSSWIINLCFAGKLALLACFLNSTNNLSLLTHIFYTVVSFKLWGGAVLQIPNINITNILKSIMHQLTFGWITSLLTVTPNSYQYNIWQFGDIFKLWNLVVSY